MRLTKLGHACVRLERDGSVLVIDPGSAPFADAAAALEGADAVLITHQHPDHVDADAVRAAYAADPGLLVVAPTDMVSALEGLGDSLRGVGPGESLEAAGFQVATVGGQHAEIHPELPRPENVGYLIDGGAIYHPGDAFAVPGVEVETLLVPVHAPWSKIAEVIDFVRAVAPLRAYAIHDGLLNETGLGLIARHVGNLGGATYERLTPGTAVDL